MDFSFCTESFLYMNLKARKWGAKRRELFAWWVRKRIANDIIFGKTALIWHVDLVWTACMHLCGSLGEWGCAPKCRFVSVSCPQVSRRPREEQDLTFLSHQERPQSRPGLQRPPLPHTTSFGHEQLWIVLLCRRPMEKNVTDCMFVPPKVIC